MTTQFLNYIPIQNLRKEKKDPLDLTETMSESVSVVVT